MAFDTAVVSIEPILMVFVVESRGLHIQVGMAGRANRAYGIGHAHVVALDASLLSAGSFLVSLVIKEDGLFIQVAVDGEDIAIKGCTLLV